MSKPIFSKKHKENGKSGFTFVEVVVVFAVLAVLCAVLAPALLHNTELSRAQKDESAMSEVCQAVRLALADPECLDEALLYSCTNNYVTYTDSSGAYGTIINDEEFWAPDGAGFATTITMNPKPGPNGRTIYSLDEALVNDMTYGNGSVAQTRIMTGARIENNQGYWKNASLRDESLLYNVVRQSVGDTVSVDSATYGNSSYTIFIVFENKDGTITPNVYGMFNGTNLSEDCSSSKGSGTYTYVENKPETTLTGGTTDAIYNKTDLVGSGGGGGNNGDGYKTEDATQDMESEDLEYYSSLAVAVSDINNNTIGVNATLPTMDGAQAVINTTEAVPVLVLLSNATTDETINITAPMKINLNGHRITSTADTAIAYNADLTIIGNGGSIVMPEHQSAEKVYILKDVGTNSLKVNGGTYNISNVQGTNQTYGFLTCGPAEIRNITMKALGNSYTRLYGLGAKGQLLVYDSNLHIFQNQAEDQTDDTVRAYGIYSSCKTTFNGVYNTNVNASWYTISGYLDEIYNGIHSSYGNGMFLNGSSTKTIKVKNITFHGVANWPSECQRFWRNANNMLAFGGSADFSDYHIYLSNCRFDGPEKNVAIRVQGAYNERRNSFYMSDTQFTMGVEKFLSMYEAIGEHKVYFGVNNNVDASNIIQNGVTTFTVNESYKDI